MVGRRVIIQEVIRASSSENTTPKPNVSSTRLVSLVDGDVVSPESASSSEAQNRNPPGPPPTMTIFMPRPPPSSARHATILRGRRRHVGRARARTKRQPRRLVQAPVSVEVTRDHCKSPQQNIVRVDRCLAAEKALLLQRFANRRELAAKGREVPCRARPPTLRAGFFQGRGFDHGPRRWTASVSFTQSSTSRMK